jgi:hypothetical protein
MCLVSCANVDSIRLEGGGVQCVQYVPLFGDFVDKFGGPFMPETLDPACIIREQAFAEASLISNL